ncbi:MAG: riboflavin synthase [Kofleriaceae bacterium]|nr:riboflavin synthase [Kofleriaceae bacterium]
MFTGLVEDVGTVAALQRRNDALVLTVRPRTVPIAELVIGESISHDGVCLTVTGIHSDSYTVLAGAETLARTTLGRLRIGNKVNLERALRLGDRLGGHWVTGHIDGTGELVVRRDMGANLLLGVHCSPALLRYVVAKGSIALCGVSLTVNAVDASSFSVAIIPHTNSNTSLADVRIGDAVNLEVDLIAKHVEKLLVGHMSGPTSMPDGSW